MQALRFFSVQRSQRSPAPLRGRNKRHGSRRQALRVQDPAVLFIEVFRIHIGGEDLPHEHVVGTEGQDLSHPAFEADGALRDPGSSNAPGGELCEAERCKLVHVPTGLHPAPVGGAQETLCGKAQDELSCPLDDVVGISRFADGDRDHHGIRADGARPGGCHDVGSPLLVLTCHHDRGYRIEEVCRSPVRPQGAALFLCRLSPGILVPVLFHVILRAAFLGICGKYSPGSGPPGENSRMRFCRMQQPVRQYGCCLIPASSAAFVFSPLYLLLSLPERVGFQRADV